MKKTHLLSVLALGISAACHAETYPAPVGPSQSDFGGVGLLQTPTARMAREGEMSLNYRDNDQYRYYSASVQLFPWLETTLRYTDVRTKKYSSVESFSGDQTYKDKAFDVKLRLWEESYWMPQVAVGARDIGGTGLFDAEYIVASKAWGPFDFSLGLGWGYLGTSGNVSNPFCSYSDKFCSRDNSYKEAGSVDGSDMFHGPASLFGGVEYQTPWQPLRLKLEYIILRRMPSACSCLPRAISQRGLSGTVYSSSKNSRAGILSEANIYRQPSVFSQLASPERAMK